MPRAEVGSTKHLNNKMKAKGLQRLRWYCQVCERQMRDENGFKCHVQSESHVRQMLLVGEDPKKFINDYSKQFQRDFLQLLRVGHGEKKVHINQFYQEYIHNKEHIHMNATRWPSLTEFAKHLGREGIVRVSEDEKGLYISWIDNSPEALRRQDALRRKERQDKGDEDREQKLLREQVDRANAQIGKSEKMDDVAKELQRAEGEKIKLDFALKPVPAPKLPETQELQKAPNISLSERNDSTPTQDPPQIPTPPEEEGLASKPKISLGFGGAAKPKNVFAAAKKNPLAQKKNNLKEPPKKMTEMERIMKEEIERKRAIGDHGHNSVKRQRF